MGFLIEIDISALWDDLLLLHLYRNIFVFLVSSSAERCSRIQEGTGSNPEILKQFFLMRF